VVNFIVKKFDLGIDEIQRIYDFEMRRNDSIESKASYLIGFASLTITILLFIINFYLSNNDKINGFSYLVFISITGLALVVLSLIFLIAIIATRQYETPFFKYGKLENNLKTIYFKRWRNFKS